MSFRCLPVLQLFMAQFPVVKYPKAVKFALFEAIPPVEQPASSRLSNPPEKIPSELWTELIIVCLLLIIILPGLGLLLAGAYAYWRTTDSLNTYPKRLKLYQDSEYHQTASQKPSKFDVHKYRKGLLAHTLQQTETYDSPNGSAMRGKSEAFFKQHLERHFGQCIYTQVQLRHPSFPNMPYTPDFAYVDRHSGLHIDIEIDEPYYMDDCQQPQPNHYDGQPKEVRRDNFFNSKGWIIIRFSEEQIVRQPQECCKVIAEQVSRLTGVTQILEQFSSTGSVIPQSQWTLEEAELMAKRRYRDTYRDFLKTTASR